MKKVLPSVIIGITVIVAAIVLGGAYKYKYRQQQTIEVNGGAEINFSSNLIVWTGSFSRKAESLEKAFSDLKIDEQKVRQFLQAEGINMKDVIFDAVNISKDYDNKYNNEGRITGSVFSGYTLTQSIKVQSKDIDNVEKVSREITGLIQSGVAFNSNAPAYYYTRLADLKIDLLSKATAAGRQRAETIAKNSGQSLGTLKSADMGVFQIIGQYSNESYSWGGAFNTDSKEKTASITVKMSFAVK